MYKQAETFLGLSEKLAAFDKIPEIEEMFPDDEVARAVAYMIATSHEYKKPNTNNAISFVKNYTWKKTEINPNRLQGINKPVIQEKVDGMVKNMRKPKPLIVVNQFNGIRPQTPGKKILVDGHHRLEAYKVKEWNPIPVYEGTYTGSDSNYLNFDFDFTTERPLLFAIDFDGTIVENKFPKIGAAKQETVEFIKDAKAKGHKIMIYTCRTNKELDAATEFLKANNIPYDYVNSNPDFGTGVKPYADAYIDDRAVNVNQIGFLNVPKFVKKK